MPALKKVATKSDAYANFIEPEQIRLSKSQLRKYKKYKDMSDEELDDVADTFYQLATSLFEKMKDSLYDNF